MVHLLLAGAAALAMPPPIHATAAGGVTQARLERSDYWVQVTTFDLQHIPWTVTCMNSYSGNVVCQARNIDVLRDAVAVRFDGDELWLTFKGQDRFGPYNFVVDVEGLSGE